MNDYYPETFKVSPDAAWDNLRDITVKDFKGNVTHYYDIVAAVKAVGKYDVDKLRGDYLRQSSAAYFWLSYAGDSHAFYTAENIRIPVWKLKEVAEQVGEPVRRYRHWRGGAFKFRQGPVEGIHCWKAGRYRGYRKIGTYGARREADFFDRFDEDALEYGLKVRCKRNRSNLPTSWDDIHVSDYYKKSWKNYRDHQWKAK